MSFRNTGHGLNNSLKWYAYERARNIANELVNRNVSLYFTWKSCQSTVDDAKIKGSRCWRYETYEYAKDQRVNGGLSNLIWLDIKVTVKLKVVNEV
jgi:hypothetical protein